MYNRILSKEAKIAVVGLGYVGLPIAIEFAKKFPVIGFDISEKRVEMMKNGIDPSNEVDKGEFEGIDLKITADVKDLGEANFYIVAVPTPIDEHLQPDLKPLLGAGNTVGQVIKKGDYVVFESTVYPGCTEEDCVPVIEQVSGLEYQKDFKVGYSPERINPGDKVNTLTSITKIVSGSDEEALDNVAKIYELILKAGTYRASSIKVAEAAKIIENTQRDVNIALMNELSIIFNKLDINTFEVLEAAGTKWNFLNFFPGLVGGHCIGVDPYYLVHKAKQLGYHPQIINSGRFVNDSMGGYIAKQTVKQIAAQDKNIRNSKVLVMGITFKENVSDIRNTKVAHLVQELESYKVNVDVVDPHADAKEVSEEYNIHLAEKISDNYDAVIVAVNHKAYTKLTEDYFLDISSEGGVMIDVKGIYRNKISKLNYWSL
ncbi:MAG: nucleotide sugar dehydrogenase [Bacteroidota bacterium]|nr:nucleotide sugar dehydrogenase [Bacteroidota bacterium]